MNTVLYRFALFSSAVKVFSDCELSSLAVDVYTVVQCRSSVTEGAMFTLVIPTELSLVLALTL